MNSILLLVSLDSAKLREARSLQEAIDQTEQTMPDVVLINLELPGLNGIEATRELPHGLLPILGRIL